MKIESHLLIKEYESLRLELNDNKKFIFERPLVIASACMLFFYNLSGTPFVVCVPPVAIFLLAYNLSFTGNRLNSNARIIAYIMYSIEANKVDSCKWETFLFNFRKYAKECEKKYLRIYPNIYLFHTVFFVLFLILEGTMCIYTYNDFFPKEAIPELKQHLNVFNAIAFSVFTIVAFGYSLYVSIRNSPGKINKNFLEQDDTVQRILLNVNLQSNPYHPKTLNPYHQKQQQLKTNNKQIKKNQ